MPSSLVTTVRSVLSVFLSVTVTPGRTPAVESVVTPVIVPVVSCAEAVPHNTAARSAVSPSRRICDLLPPAAYHSRVRARMIGLRHKDDLAKRARFHQRFVRACSLGQGELASDHRI